MEESSPAPVEISRSARKRDAKSVEQLAIALAELGDADFAKLPASAPILAALRETRAIKGHGSRKRQLKFFAGMLRREPEEAEQLRLFVEGEHQQHRDETRLVHQLEQLREQLCVAGTRNAALEKARQLCPNLDQPALKRLIDAYRGPEDKKNYRLIFRCLREGSSDQ